MVITMQRPLRVLERDEGGEEDAQESGRAFKHWISSRQFGSTAGLDKKKT